MYPITTITSSLLAVIYFYLSVNVIKLRREHKVSVGSKRISGLEMAIRAHGNFAEYVPLVLILIFCAEANHANQIVVSLLAFAFVLGRLFHARAFLYETNHFKYRVKGVLLTLLVMVFLALLNIGIMVIELLK